MIERYTCTCCGAPINRSKMKCEYCGTEYKLENEIPVIRMETFRNPVKEFTACMLIDKYDAVIGGEDYMKFAVEHLARELLPAVMEGMSIRTMPEPSLCGAKLYGRVRVVIPKDIEASRAALSEVVR